MHTNNTLFLSSLLLLIINFFTFSTSEGLVHFYGQKVVRADIKDEVQVRIVEKLEVDVWSHESVVVVGLNDFVVNDAQEEVLLSSGIDFEVIIPDFEQHLENERQTLKALSDQPLASWYDTYHPLQEIYDHYLNFSTAFRSLNATFTASIGKSVEGRDLTAFTFGFGSSGKKVYIQGGQHAREWIGHATTAYVTEQLLTLYSTDSQVKNLVDGLLFVVVPVVNPDGYVYTWNTNRSWRKNRRLNTGGSYGVDLNRNWDDHWGGNGSSATPTSENYRGAAPFSEPETTAASKYFLANGPFGGAIDFHSYGQLILRPFGWTQTEFPFNEAQEKEAGDGIRDTIRGIHNVSYTSQSGWQLYYSSGNARDWFNSAGKSISYTIELRDTGTYGFQLPAAQIIPTGEEIFASFKFFANYILTH